MPLRDLVVTAIVFALLPFCFTRPWIGVLVWSWLGFMNPHRLTWGFAYAMPFAQMVALATLAGFLFTKERKPLPRTIEVKLLFVLWAFFVITTLTAFNPDDAWDQLDKVSKILLITTVSMFLFQERKKLHALVLVTAMSIGFFGLKGGIWALTTGGGFQVLGPPGSFIEGNTEVGLALNMVLPLLLFLSRHEERRWLRRLLRVMFVFSIVGVLFTYSRGAFLGLAVVLPLMFLKSRLKLLIIPLAILGFLFGKAVMPQQWLERMGSIETYEQDRSANMRLNSWYVSYRLGLDHPFLGGGFRPFSPDLYLKYSPTEEWNDTQDAHSIYFQVLAEHGFVGLGLYLGLILCMLASLRRLMAACKREPSRRWIHDCAQMLEVSLAGFLVSGAFLSMSYFDLFFSLVAITVMLKVLAREPVGAPGEVRTLASPSAPGGVPVPMRPRLAGR